MVTLDKQQLQRFDDEGYLVVHGVVSPAEAATLLERIDGMLAGRYDTTDHVAGPASDRGPTDPGRLILQVMPLKYPSHDPVLRAFAGHALLAAIASELLGRRGVEVFQQQALVKLPGQRNGTPWHQDNHYWRMPPRHAVTAWVPLLPTSAASGTMWIQPRSHRAGPRTHASANGISAFQAIVEPVELSDCIPLELPVGSVSFHAQDTIHGSPDNLGQSRRAAFAQHYRGVEVDSQATPSRV